MQPQQQPEHTTGLTCFSATGTESAELVSIERDGVLLEQVAPTVYLLRGYPAGGHYPQPYTSVGTVVVEGAVARYMGFLRQDGAGRSFDLKQARFVYEFFRNLGCTQQSYERSDGTSLKQTRKPQ